MTPGSPDSSLLFGYFSWSAGALSCAAIVFSHEFIDHDSTELNLPGGYNLFSHNQIRLEKYEGTSSSGIGHGCVYAS